MVAEAETSKWTAGDYYAQMVVNGLYRIKDLYQLHYSNRANTDFSLIESEIQMLWDLEREHIVKTSGSETTANEMDAMIQELSNTISEFYRLVELESREADVIQAQVLSKIQQCFLGLTKRLHKSGILVMTTPTRRFHAGKKAGEAPGSLFNKDD